MENVIRESGDRLMPASGASISIVSHGHCTLIAGLLNDLARFCDSIAEVVLTLNIPETWKETQLPFPVRVICNDQPKGFGANHNAAFAVASGEFFCVLNPDVRLDRDPFPPLYKSLTDPQVGVAAPYVMSPRRELEDSARPFPSPATVIGKALRLTTGRYPAQQPPQFPDWVAGIFMLFRRGVFESIGGFDESFFLYYEDIDLCARLRLAGYRVAVCADSTVVHDARRSSHRRVKYLLWHVRSVLRFFFSPVYRQIRRLV